MRIRSNALSSVKAFCESELGNVADLRTIHAWFFTLCKAFLSLDKSYLIAHPEQRIQESQMLWFTDAVKRLRRHEPIQYIIGHETFFGTSFFVGPEVLIPRPETEELLDWILKDHADKAGTKVVDWCTGSGCIALSLKLKRPSWEVHGVDISEAALAYARRSGASLQLDVHWHHDDLYHPQTMFQSNLLISNPPYVLPREKSLMAPNVLDYEPHLALFVEEEAPLAPYIQLAQIAQSQLCRGGAGYFEINESLGDACMQVFERAGFDCSLRKDLNGKDRMLKIIRP